MFIPKTKNLCEEQQRKRKREINLILCLLTAVAVGVTPAWASGIGDILLSMVGGLITIIAQFILGLMEIIAGLFLKSMSIDIASIDSQIAILSAFEYFAEGIRILAIFIAAIVAMWHIFVSLWGPLVGAKQTQSVGSAVTRAFIFIPGCFIVQDLAMIFFRELQKIYNSFLTANGGESIFTGLSEWITLEAVKNMMGADITTGIAAPLQDAAAILISCALVIIITWNFIKFLLEMTQRFVVMLVYAYLSPLACACGVSPGTEAIAKKSIATFFSSGILWILNVWCVGVGLRLFESARTAVANVATFFLWALVTYGFFKIIQQLDDIFNVVGANNVRLSGSMLDDLASMNRFRKAVTDMGKTIGGVRAASKNFAQNGFFGPKGANSENPVTPQATKISNMAGVAGAAAAGVPKGQALTGAAANATGATKAANADPIKPNNPQAKTTASPGQGPRLNMKAPTFATTEGGAMPRSMGQQAGDAVTGALKATTAGMVLQGIGKTGENIANRWDAATNENKLAQDNAAVSKVHDALSRANTEDRNTRMKNLAQSDPKVLSNEAVKQYVGETLGLGENQKVSSLNVDKNGILSATTISTDDSGKITMNKISDVGQLNADTVTGKTATNEPQYFTGRELSELGENQASLSFDSRGLGEDISGKLIKNEAEPGGDTATFSFVPNMGSEEMNNAFAVDVKAPKDMSAEQVGNVLMGTADAATVEKFKQGGGDRHLFDNAYIPANIVEDKASADRTVINSPNTAFAIHDSQTGEKLSMQKTASGETKDTWTAYSNGSVVGSMEVKAGTGAGEVADRVLHSEDAGAQAIRQATSVGDFSFDDNVVFAQTGGNIDNVHSIQEQFSEPKFTNGITENPDSSVSIQNAQTGEQITLSNVYSHGGKDSWQAYRGDDYIGSIDVPSGTSAKDVAASIYTADGQDYEAIRQSVSIGTDRQSSNVTFTSSDGSESCQFKIGTNRQKNTPNINYDDDANNITIPADRVSESYKEPPVSVQVGNDMMNSSDTEISVCGFDGASSVDLRKTASENGNDYWSAYSNGNYISDVEVPSGTGAKEVADRVLYSDGESYEAIRQAADINDYPQGSEVKFIPSQDYSGASTFSTAIESESLNMAHAGCEFTFEKLDGNGRIVTSTGYITPTGHSDASGIEYQFGGASGQWDGIVNINANISPEELAAALAHKDGLGIEGVREVRQKLGIQNAFSDEETKSLRDALTKARKASAGTEENPVGK